MIKKIPCGGFSYDDSEIAFEDGVIHPIGGGGGGGWPSDLPKPSIGGYGYTEGEATTIEWDGNTSGLVSVADTYYKVANYTAVTKADLISCIVSLQNDDTHPTPFEVDEADIKDSVIPHAIFVSDYAIFVSEPTSYGPINFEESGIYFSKMNSLYVKSLTYGRISKIDSKYLPFKVFNFTVEYDPDRNTTGLDVNYEDLEKACRNPNIIVNGHLSVPKYHSLYNLTKITSGTHFICFNDWVSGDKVKLYYYKVSIVSDDEIEIEKGYIDGDRESE